MQSPHRKEPAAPLHPHAHLSAFVTKITVFYSFFFCALTLPPPLLFFRKATEMLPLASLQMTEDDVSNTHSLHNTARHQEAVWAWMDLDRVQPAFLTNCQSHYTADKECNKYQLIKSNWRRSYPLAACISVLLTCHPTLESIAFVHPHPLSLCRPHYNTHRQTQMSHTLSVTLK